MYLVSKDGRISCLNVLFYDKVELNKISILVRILLSIFNFFLMS